MPPRLTSGDISNLDKQIEHLMECKPLSETEVKVLCEKVNEKKKKKGEEKKYKLF